MTESAHALSLAESVRARQYAVGSLASTVWVRDTTFIPMGEDCSVLLEISIPRFPLHHG